MSDKAKKTRTELARTRRRNAARRLTQRRKTPHGRLDADGASTNKNIYRRLQWLAHEWKIADPLPKVMQTPTKELADFGTTSATTGCSSATSKGSSR